MRSQNWNCKLEQEPSVILFSIHPIAQNALKVFTMATRRGARIYQGRHVAADS